MGSPGKGHSGHPSAFWFSSPGWLRLSLPEGPCGWSGHSAGKTQVLEDQLLASCLALLSLEWGPRLLQARKWKSTLWLGDRPHTEVCVARGDPLCYTCCCPLTKGTLSAGGQGPLYIDIAQLIGWCDAALPLSQHEQAPGGSSGKTRLQSWVLEQGTPAWMSLA